MWMSLFGYWFSFPTMRSTYIPPFTIIEINILKKYSCIIRIWEIRSMLICQFDEELLIILINSFEIGRHQMQSFMVFFFCLLWGILSSRRQPKKKNILDCVLSFFFDCSTSTQTCLISITTTNLLKLLASYSTWLPQKPEISFIDDFLFRSNDLQHIWDHAEFSVTQ